MRWEEERVGDIDKKGERIRECNGGREREGERETGDRMSER